MNDNEKIYLRLRYIWIGGMLVGIPLGSMLGQWAPFVWLPLAFWAMWRIWKEQQ